CAIDVFALLSTLNKLGTFEIPEKLFMGLNRRSLVNNIVNAIWLIERARFGFDRASNRLSKLIFGARNIGKTTILRALLGACAVLCARVLPVYVKYSAEELPWPEHVIEYGARAFGYEWLEETRAVAHASAFIGSDEFQELFPEVDDKNPTAHKKTP